MSGLKGHSTESTASRSPPPPEEISHDLGMNAQLIRHCKGQPCRTSGTVRELSKHAPATHLYLFLSLYALWILSVTGLQLVTRLLVTGGYERTQEGQTVHQGHGEKEQARHRPWALNPGPPRVHGAREPSTLSPQGPRHTLAELGMQDVYIKMSEKPVTGQAV